MSNSNNNTNTNASGACSSSRRTNPSIGEVLYFFTRPPPRSEGIDTNNKSSSVKFPSMRDVFARKQPKPDST
ncbi:hypothetical protein MtrunA17_Chr7g0248281 [Medicago truncatula]|uniref:Uncharacterized protein n=1 Tax=Medicago truncatula TaxID=3880 RepID=A2Q4F2_MEDTR|nr:hypothetical protein MtrDRAFT_AC157473g18v2 [Medicago truncatula]RHN47007.1 hypothetical protein MtrunA17_Chr7g0248281 [Medicago truncatula]